jgi:hypothetical protein
MLRQLLTITLSLTLLTAVSRTVLAQDEHRDSNGSVQPPDDDLVTTGNAGLVTIYSNLGPKGRTYDARQGWLVDGLHTRFPQWIAMPFRIPANATIMQVQIAVGHYSGTNGFTLAIAEDDHGLPGTIKYAWEVKNLPPVGACCTLEVENDVSGIKAQKGETYWVVAQTDSSNADTSDQWAYTWNHVKSNDIAVRAQPFVWVRYHGGVSAFAVYGTEP